MHLFRRKGADDAPAGALGKSGNVEVQFTNLRYVKHSKAGDKVEIIKGVSGKCSPSRLLAVMGRSGAGKTTLLDILAGNEQGGIVTGEVLVNGQPFHAATWRKLSTYVLQQDVLLATATVAEALTTSAYLRLPQRMPRREKNRRVHDILQELDLARCAGTMIGDATGGITGISGGERRRVSVGIGLVTDPRAIFCDEPTSGLDSETALHLIRLLRQLARRQRMVVCTIHQPNSDIVDCFDDLLLMAEGRCAYAGPWSAAVGYFAGLGHPCPIYKNPADFFMSLTGDSVRCAELAEQFRTSGLDRGASGFLPDLETGTSPSPPAEALVPRPKEAELVSLVPRPAPLARQSARLSGRLPERMSGLSEASSSGRGVGASGRWGGAPAQTCCWWQVAVLSVRFGRSWWRDPILLVAYLGQYCFAGVFIGLMYLQLGHKDKAALFDRQASLFLLLAVLAFTPSETTCTLWDQERALLRRESQSGAYSITAFYLAKTLVTVPYQVGVTSVFTLVVYFMVGYQAALGKFAVFWLICCLFQLTSETLGLVCAVATRTSTTAIIYCSAILLVLLSFDGFLISETPFYFVWVQKISYLSYAYSGLYKNEVSGLQLSTDRVSITLPTDHIPGGGVHTSLSPVDTHMPLRLNITVLGAILAGLRLLVYMELHIAARLRFL